MTNAEQDILQGFTEAAKLINAYYDKDFNRNYTFDQILQEVSDALKYQGMRHVYIGRLYACLSAFGI